MSGSAAGGRTARLRRKTEAGFLDVLLYDPKEAAQFLLWAAALLSEVEEVES